MYDSRDFIHADVHLHSEVPVAGFLGRVHFRVTLFVSVFRRTRRFYKRAVNYRSFAEEKTSVGELLFEQFKDPLVQAVFLKQMPETQDCSLIRTF